MHMHLLHPLPATHSKRVYTDPHLRPIRTTTFGKESTALLPSHIELLIAGKVSFCKQNHLPSSFVQTKPPIVIGRSWDSGVENVLYELIGTIHTNKMHLLFWIPQSKNSKANNIFPFFLCRTCFRTLCVSPSIFKEISTKRTSTIACNSVQSFAWQIFTELDLLLCLKHSITSD